MTTMGTPPGTGWSIVDQQSETKIGAGNLAVEGITVWFRTQYGATSSIWLPRTSYTVDNVRRAITELATEMDSVHTLTS